jgi:hypothetical protein
MKQGCVLLTDSDRNYAVKKNAFYYMKLYAESFKWL